MWEASFQAVDNLERVTEPEREKPSKGEDHQIAMNAGFGAGFGVALGTVVFAITGEAFWIAIGPAFGVALGAAFASARS